MGFTYKNKMEEDVMRLSSEITQKKAAIKKLPEGNLICYLDKGCYRWIQSKSKFDKSRKGFQTRRYIKKSEEKLASALAYRTYLEKQIEDDEKEIKAIKQYLKYCSPGSSADEYMKKNPELIRLLSPYTTRWDVNSTRWINDKCERKNGISNNSPLITKSGEYVRSKGEVIICDRLYDHEIPFKIEQAISTNPAFSIIDDLELPFYGPRYEYIFPDITILDKNVGEILWEHMGMMDKPEYVQHCSEKIFLYSLLGYYPFKNLILTFETNGKDLDTIWIDRIINHYLLH